MIRKVNFGGELSEVSGVTTGLRHSDTLSQALFKIALESVMRVLMTQAKDIKVKNTQNLTSVTYVDNIVLITKIDNDLKNTANILLKERKKMTWKSMRQRQNI